MSSWGQECQRTTKDTISELASGVWNTIHAVLGPCWRGDGACISAMAYRMATEGTDVSHDPRVQVRSYRSDHNSSGRWPVVCFVVLHY
ncbi:hypothetical protein CRENBAI_014920 [Crenichthys baileyi]|uniref:Uncharacterized protein n=1 Tax=Crenichthys baileyi TaxID=28760 RepID=A0AAV9RRN9_9TELE